MIAAVAVIVMCAAGLVGAGYAYTASTVNEENSASAEYITLVQGGAGEYDFADEVMVYWDQADKKVRAGDGDIGKNAYNVAGTGTEAVAINDLLSTYTLTDETVTTEVQAYTMVKIGQSFTLNPTSSKDSDIPTIHILFESDGINTVPVGGELWIKATCNGVSQYYVLTGDDTFTEKYWNETVWSNVADPQGINVAKNGNEYYPVTIEAYFGYKTADGGFLTKHASGVAPEAVPSAVIIPEDTTFTFTIEVDGTNHLFTLSPASGTVAVGGDITIIADRPVGWNDSITWTTGAEGIATVDDGVVHGVAAGTTTITATFTHSTEEYTATFEVTVTA